VAEKGSDGQPSEIFLYNDVRTLKEREKQRKKETLHKRGRTENEKDNLNQNAESLNVNTLTSQNAELPQTKESTTKKPASPEKGKKKKGKSINRSLNKDENSENRENILVTFSDVSKFSSDEDLHTENSFFGEDLENKKEDEKNKYLEEIGMNIYYFLKSKN
jgi:hypothetical protein